MILNVYPWIVPLLKNLLESMSIYYLKFNLYMEHQFGMLN